MTPRPPKGQRITEAPALRAEDKGKHYRPVQTAEDTLPEAPRCRKCKGGGYYRNDRWRHSDDTASSHEFQPDTAE